jgi:hypothetical protein
MITNGFLNAISVSKLLHACRVSEEGYWNDFHFSKLVSNFIEESKTLILKIAACRVSEEGYWNDFQN